MRLFFRIYDDATDLESSQEFNLDPELLANLPSLFEKYEFPDGHYKIYLQEVGSERVRLVLDVHVYEGKVVPENFREAERPFVVESARPGDDSGASTAAQNDADSPSSAASDADAQQLTEPEPIINDKPATPVPQDE